MAAALAQWKLDVRYKLTLVQRFADDELKTFELEYGTWEALLEGVEQGRQLPSVCVMRVSVVAGELWIAGAELAPKA